MMKWLSLLMSCVLLLKGALAQQDLMDRLPDCAVQCFEATLPLTDCSASNINCLCGDQDFMTAASGCNAANCTVVDSLTSTNETNAACGIPVRVRSNEIIGTTASFGGLAIIMVAMRLIHRAFSSDAQLGWDDFLIGLAGFMSLIQNIPCVVAAALGFGRDMWGMKPDHITLSYKYLYVTYFMYQVAEALCQLSICAFYLRIMTDKKTRMVVWVLIGLVTGFGIGNTFAMVFQCNPIKFVWDGWRGEFAGTCIDIRLFGFIRGGIEISLDLVIITLPLPMLAKLQMSLKKKLQIMSMFGVGFVITIVGCLRIWALMQFDQTQNPTYDNTSGVYWCVTECNLFIVVACMPAMRAILSKVFPSAFSRDRSNYGPKGQYANDVPGKGSYIRQDSRRQKSAGSLPFGVISKSMDVSVYRSNRSDGAESDVELVDRPQGSNSSA